MGAMTYDPKLVLMSYGPVILGDFADGSFITCEADQDDYKTERGTDGRVDFIRNIGRTFTVTVRIMQTSAFNDALSAARPGARNISAENFVERMRDLENIATSFEGIDKAYAISAGREVRIIVRPEKIDDLSALKLSRDIANKIESTMQYPGTIKVNVIRETRAIEFAK